MKISSVEGNRQLLDGGAMFGNAPRPVWEKWIAPDDRGRIPLACRSLLVEVDNYKILFEAGIGAFFPPKLADRFGVQSPERHLLRENLNALGITPADVDLVVLSHLHFDHAGGLLPTYQEMSSGKVELVFPKAKFVVGNEAWQRALSPHSRDRASFVPELNELLKASGRLIIYPQDPLPSPAREILEFVTTEGHTPGQLHSLIKGSGRKVFFCGDLIPGRPWVHLPITMGYDRFPERLIDEKDSVLTRAKDENWMLFFTHDPEFAAVDVGFSNGRFEPLEIQKVLNRFPI